MKPNTVVGAELRFLVCSVMFPLSDKKRHWVSAAHGLSWRSLKRLVFCYGAGESLLRRDLYSQLFDLYSEGCSSSDQDVKHAFIHPFIHLLLLGPVRCHG